MAVSDVWVSPGNPYGLVQIAPPSAPHPQFQFYTNVVNIHGACVDMATADARLMIRRWHGCCACVRVSDVVPLALGVAVCVFVIVCLLDFGQ